MRPVAALAAAAACALPAAAVPLAESVAGEGGGRAPQQPAQALRRRRTARSTSSRRAPGGRDTCLGRAPDQDVRRADRRDHADRGGDPAARRHGPLVGAHRDGDAGRRGRPTSSSAAARTYVLLQNGGDQPAGHQLRSAPTGRSRAISSRRRPGKAAPAVIVNLAAFEATHNPDRGAGPGAKLGSPPIDSDPLRVRPVPRRLRRRRRRRQRPALDRPARRRLGARGLPDADERSSRRRSPRRSGARS